jgi:hypothetical protein
VCSDCLIYDRPPIFEIDLIITELSLAPQLSYLCLLDGDSLRILVIYFITTIVKRSPSDP